MTTSRPRRPGDRRRGTVFGMLRFGSVLVGFILSILLVVVTPAVATAETSVDGCTAVPDTGRTFDFTDACSQHDRCYIERPHGDSANARRQCDREFRADMLDHCDDRWPSGRDRLARRSCQAIAWIYYGGVRLFGGLAWGDGGTAPVAV